MRDCNITANLLKNSITDSLMPYTILLFGLFKISFTSVAVVSVKHENMLFDSQSLSKSIQCLLVLLSILNEV